MNLAVLMILALAASIILGFVTNKNTGLYALAFSYLIGCFVMHLRPSEIIGLWPLNIFFVLVFVSLFYNYPEQNGTLNKLAQNIIYKFGKTARVMPFILFIAAWLMSAMGAGPYSVIMLLCPMGFTLAEKLRMNKLLCGIAVYFGAVNGGGFPTSSTAAISRGITSGLGFAEYAMTWQFIGFFISLGSFLIYLLILYFLVFKGYKIDTAVTEIEKPEPYTDVQKKSFLLILIFVFLLLAPFFLGMIFPQSGFVRMLKAFNDVGFTAIILALAAGFMKLGSERTSLAKVPWNTVIMVSGIGVLVSLSVKAGMVDMLAGYISGFENENLIGPGLSLVAGIMSLFSSTAGVVIPTLYPMVPSIYGVTGLVPIFLFTAISTGSVATGMSPISTCGMLMLGAVKEEETKSMYKQLILIAAGGLVLAVLEMFVVKFIVSALPAAQL
jgi:di/tricarboxylate transporter